MSVSGVRVVVVGWALANNRATQPLRTLRLSLCHTGARNDLQESGRNSQLTRSLDPIGQMAVEYHYV